MDALEVVDLVRVATCSKVLHGLFSEAAVKGSKEHCREASNRADLAEFRFSDVCGMLHDAAQQRDTAYERRPYVREHTDRRIHEQERDLDEKERRIREQERALDEKDRRIRVLEQALVDSQRELVEAKRARTG